MIQRIIVGVIGLPIALIPIWLGGLWAAGLILALTLIGGHEFYMMMRKGNFRPAYLLGLLCISALVLHPVSPLLPEPFYTQLKPFGVNTILAVSLIATLVYALFQVEQPLLTWFSTVAGIFYIGVLSNQVLSLRLVDQGLWWLLFGVLITWANDTSAYFAGVSIGRYKLWPRLSPKKTWEGTIVGWIGAALIGLIFVWLTPIVSPVTPPISLTQGAAIGFVAGILALFGDLAMSMLKRQVGVKDSGKIFPGHGGVLDRIDSQLFVLPFIYQFVLFIQLAA